MALNDEGPRLSRVGGPSGTRGLTALILVVVLLVGLAIIKPWSPAALGPSVTLKPPAVESFATPAGSASGVPLARLYPQCFAVTGWRVAALQGDVGSQIRTLWPVIQADSASAKTALAAAHIMWGGNVRGIGFCPPGGDVPSRRDNSARVTLWRADEAAILTLVRGAQTLDQQLADSGEVYLVPPASLATDGVWPAGAYAFRVDRGRGNAIWFALRIANVDRVPSQLPSPAPSPTVWMSP